MRRLSLVALIAANLLVALLSLRHEWGYYQAILIYWCEALVLGGYNVLRMLLVGLVGEQPLGETVSRWVEFSPGFRVLATAAGTAFFAFKFGMFSLFVGLFAMALPAFSAPEGSGGRRIALGLLAAAPSVATAIAALVLSHGVSFVRNFVMDREYARMTLLELIFWPYLRMGLVAVVLAAGLVVVRFLPGLANETSFAVVMVLSKLAVDCVSHLVEHASISGRTIRPISVPTIRSASRPSGSAP